MCPWVALVSCSPACAKFHGASQLGDVLRFGIGRSEGAYADSVLFRKDYALHSDVFVTAAISVFESVPALRTEIALDIEAIVFVDLGAKARRNQVKRLLVHRAILDGKDRARFVS